MMPSAQSSGHCPPPHQIDIFYDQTKLHHWAICLKGNTLYIIRTGRVYLNKDFFYLDQTPLLQWRYHVKNVYRMEI